MNISIQAMAEFCKSSPLKFRRGFVSFRLLWETSLLNKVASTEMLSTQFRPFLKLNKLQLIKDSTMKALLLITEHEKWVTHVVTRCGMRLNPEPDFREHVYLNVIGPTQPPV